MPKRYSVAGDGTGKTYGIYIDEDGKPPFSGKMIKRGFKSLSAACKRVEELEKKDKNKLK